MLLVTIVTVVSVTNARDNNTECHSTETYYCGYKEKDWEEDSYSEEDNYVEINKCAQLPTFYTFYMTAQPLDIFGGGACKFIITITNTDGTQLAQRLTALSMRARENSSLPSDIFPATLHLSLFCSSQSAS